MFSCQSPFPRQVGLIRRKINRSVCGCHFLNWDSLGGSYPTGAISTVDTVGADVGFGLAGVAQVCYSACWCGGGNGFWELTAESWLHPSHLVKLLGVDEVLTEPGSSLLSVGAP